MAGQERERYVLNKDFERHKKDVDDRLSQVEDDTRTTKQLVYEQQGYNKASLERLDEISNNTKGLNEKYTSLEVRQNSVELNFEKLKSEVTGKKRDNTRIIVAVISAIGVLGSAALAASHLWL